MHLKALAITVRALAAWIPQGCGCARASATITAIRSLRPTRLTDRLADPETGPGGKFSKPK
jgi:hypothetical protein